MTARRPTSRLTRLDARAPAPRAFVRLVVDYANADDFIGDFEENLSQSSTIIETARELEVGTIIEIGITFPGLRETLILPALVQSLSEEPARGYRVEFLDGGVSRLAALVERIRARDNTTLGHVINVLIVEDNHHICELVRNGLAASTRRELKDVSFAFETADNGAAALDLMKTRTFDAAIVDVYLPVLDGASLIQQARSSLGLTFPIITMSGGGEDEQEGGGWERAGWHGTDR